LLDNFSQCEIQRKKSPEIVNELSCRTNIRAMSGIQPLGRSVFGVEKNRGKLPTLAEATALLEEWVSNDKLRLHMRQVAAVLRAWAIEREGADEQTALKWELTGLLHDADWEKHPDDHCRIIVEKLEEMQMDPELIHGIASHGPKYFGVEPENNLDKMMYMFDELSGFIHAAALIRPTRYEGLDVKSVLKRLKTLSFAAQVSRDDIYDAQSRINIPLEEIITFVIEHQRDVQ
jgi:predicted hydrolase (HD superfamily)